MSTPPQRGHGDERDGDERDGDERGDKGGMHGALELMLGLTVHAIAESRPLATPLATLRLSPELTPAPPPALPTVDLGPPKAAPSVGRATSRAAAAGMSDDVRGALEKIVFEAIYRAGHEGMTDDELEVATGLSHQCESARRNALTSKRKVRDSGMRRPTRTGSPAIVWVVGEGIPIVGAPNRRAPARPSAEELREAADALLDEYGNRLARVRTWLLALAEQ